VNKKKLLPIVLAASIAGELIVSERHHDKLAAQPHTDVEIASVEPAIVAPPASGGAGGAPTSFRVDQIS